MIAPSADPVGIEIVESLARLGFDYIELSLSHLAALPQPAVAPLKARLDRAGVPCEACNNFFPATIPLTGSEARLPAALEYAKSAIERAAILGARIIVFGSAGAKNIPPGFPRENAWTQLVVLLQHLGPVAAQHAITIAIEPLNRRESNIINGVAEGLRLAREVHHPNIRLLVDYYHFRIERESPDVLLAAGSALCHLHLAQVPQRVFPWQEEKHMVGFFAALRRSGYGGRCSIEAFTRDLEADASGALRLLKAIASRSVCSVIA